VVVVVSLYLFVFAVSRNEMPYVFDAPTTLDVLEDLIVKYASTGSDASTIIERIHASNSVRLDHRNGQKMQNFYDVLLRRFMELGDNVYVSGRGGDIVDRFSQLDCITKVLFKMAQESPESAGAVWNRRIGILHNAHEKRLRDSVFEHEETEDGDVWTPWPSTGVFLLLRLVGNIFPVTDKRHHVVTPTMLFMAQMVSQTPVSSEVDLAMGVLLSALLIEYSKEAQRVVPEALGFIASTIRLFAPQLGKITNPALYAAYEQDFCVLLRRRLSKYKHDSDSGLPRLKLERDFIFSSDSQFPVAILSTCLGLVEKCASYLKGAFSVPSEAEALYEASAAILSLNAKSMPAGGLQQKIAKTAAAIADVCPTSRPPLTRRIRPTVTEIGIKTLAPRMEDPTRYSMSRDKGKKSVQAAIDRTRREYKREHKAISRELRMDGAFIEQERRTEQTTRDNKARAKRQKNFAWLESEQASMNQQVRQGGGLLKGGGMGLARAKAATGRMGIKKGGKF
jgi:nucleolar protein 14